jgi:hypothetical protein
MSTKDDSLVIKFKFDDDSRKTYQLDLADMTNREQIETEEFFNQPLEEAISTGWLFQSRKGMVWLAYIARRRREPEFTYENAVDAYDTLVEEDEKTPPTKASKDSGSQS